MSCKALRAEGRALLVALGLLGAKALAQEAAAPPDGGTKQEIGGLDLEELLDQPVEAVSRRPEKVSEAAANVFVVTSEDIERHGFRTLGELLRSVPGLFLFDDSIYSLVGVRGVGTLGDYSTRILVLVDGHPRNTSLAFGESHLGRDLPLSMAAIKRVEVVKGPVGGVYGPTAFLAVVNVVTRAAGDDRESPLQVAASGELSQEEVRDGEASALAVTRFGDLRLTADLATWRSAGNRRAFPELLADEDREVPAGGVVDGLDSAYASSAYVRGEWGPFFARLGLGWWGRGVATGAYGAVIEDERNRYSSATGTVELGWQREVVNGLELQLRASADHFRFTDNFVYPDPPDDVGLYIDDAYDNRWTASARALWRPLEDTTVSAGLELRYHDTEMHSRSSVLPNRLEDPEGGVGVGPIHNSFSTYNAQVLAEQRLLQRLRLQAGLTAYLSTLFGGRLTPRAAALLEVSPQDLVKLVYSEGFRPPAIIQAFYEDGVYYLPNAQLKPELAQSLELVYQRSFGGIASFQLSAFGNRYADLIRYVSVPGPGYEEIDPADPKSLRLQSVNEGTLRTYGVDFGFQLKWGDWLTGYGGFSWQRSVEPYPNFLPWGATLSLSTRALHPALTLSGRLAMGGARLKDEANLLPDSDPFVPPYAVVDVYVVWRVPAVAGLHVELGVYNLLDAAVTHPASGDFAPITEVREGYQALRLTLRYQY